MALCVVRSRHTLVKPCEKTPSGPLELSGMDKVPVLRCNARTIHVYKAQRNTDDHELGQLLSSEAETKAKVKGSTTSNSDGEGREAWGVIREALSKALVAYYPLAGRLRSVLGEVHIECSGEGILLVEASANRTLHALNYLDLDDAAAAAADVGDASIPSSYDYNDLLPQQSPSHLHSDQPEAHSEINDDQPLVQMQVTQFACGGFVIGLIFSHTVCDGLGAAQFLNAVGELARGLDKLSVQPVWCRDFFVTTPPPQPPTNANSPPPLLPPMPQPNYKLEKANVDISMDQINKLKREFQEETGQRCSSFEIVAASFWSCRTKAIVFPSSSASDDDESSAKFVFFANCRQLLEPPLPKGYYGNCFFPVTVTAPKQRVAQAPLSEVVKLIQKAKAELPKEFAKYRNNKSRASAHDDGGEGEEEDPFLPPLSYDTLFVSEWGRLGFNDLDMGWGPPVQIVPIQGSPVIPAGIVGWQPAPKYGIRLMTWCVQLQHRYRFLHLLSQLTN